MPVLEEMEWCDYWWEKATDGDTPRVLLVGDSITRGYKPFVNEYLKGEALADMVASSRAVDNPLLLKELFSMLDHPAYRYQILHFNNGLHGQHLSIKEFEENYRVVMHLLRTYTNTRIVLATCTPAYQQGYENPYNQLALERNRFIREYALEQGLTVHDLYQVSYDRPEIRLPDGLHYNDAGARLQARQVADVIHSCLQDNK